jgi:transposase
MAVEGATTKKVLETYAEHFLAPELEPGQVVVMDNLGAHRPERVRQLIEGRGCELIYLPPYSPDLNPIEEAFAKIKHILRKMCARAKEALIEAMGGHWEPSIRKTYGDSSLTVATASRRSNYERRCEILP